MLYQHDGARPHTAKINERHWAQHGAKKGFDINVVTQPPQSPDVHCNDLAFFASLQSDTELVAKRNVVDLIEAVQKTWEEFPKEPMEAVWRVLYASFKGILTVEGDNSYCHHTGSRAAHTLSPRRGDSHDRFFPLAEYRKAEKARDALAKNLEGTTEGSIATSDSSQSG